MSIFLREFKRSYGSFLANKCDFINQFFFFIIIVIHFKSKSYSPTNSLATTLTAKTNTNSVATALESNNQKIVKVVKIHTNKRNNIRQSSLNKKSISLNSKGNTTLVTGLSDMYALNPVRNQSNEILVFSDNLVKPTVTNKCKLETELKSQDKYIPCIDKKPQIAKALLNTIFTSTKTTTPITNKPQSFLSKNKANNQSLTLKRGGQDIKLTKQKEHKVLIGN